MFVKQKQKYKLSHPQQFLKHIYSNKYSKNSYALHLFHFRQKIRNDNFFKKMYTSSAGGKIHLND